MKDEYRRLNAESITRSMRIPSHINRNNMSHDKFIHMSGRPNINDIRISRGHKPIINGGNDYDKRQYDLDLIIDDSLLYHSDINLYNN